MLRPILAAVVGCLLVAAGLAWSPFPWAAPVFVGLVLMGAGLLVDVEGGADDATG